AVVVHHNAGEHAGISSAGSDPPEVLARHVCGFLHFLLGIEKCFVNHCSAPSSSDTSVPILSPRKADVTFPAPSIPKTTMGMLLSMHKLKAVASATRNPRSSTS